MKKLLSIAFISVFLAFGASSCVVEDSCECMYGDLPTCLNAIDLGEGCTNDCDWDYITDCDLDCYDLGYVGGTCEYFASGDDCVCY
ncbi:MAG: hypothetical protein JXR95_14825 [Deltaproteobacteria bacterium]|nr:hypothetical protein [Deltaproteobacteria bacterium]